MIFQLCLKGQPRTQQRNCVEAEKKKRENFQRVHLRLRSHCSHKILHVTSALSNGALTGFSYLDTVFNK